MATTPHSHDDVALPQSHPDHVPGTHQSHRALHQHGPASHTPSTPPIRAAGSAHDGHGPHDKHTGHSVEMFRQKFWGTLLLSIPTPRSVGSRSPQPIRSRPSPDTPSKRAMWCSCGAIPGMCPGSSHSARRPTAR